MPVPTWTTVQRVLPVCNTVSLGILVTFVLVLLGRTHRLQLDLDQQQVAMNNLKLQVQQEQQGQIQELTAQVQDEHSLTVLQMAGTFSILTCLWTAFHMSTHLLAFNNALVQRKILAILWISPIYSLTSFLGLVWPQSNGYLRVLKDCYEAYVIYNFLGFLLAVLGKNTAVEMMARHELPRTWIFRSRDQPPLEKARTVMLECQVLCMQFVLVRPFTAVTSFVFETLDENGEEDDSWSAYLSSPGFWCSMVTNVSVFCAFRGLLTLYHAVRDDLQWLQPLNKFLSIKFIVFVMFWQGLAISILVHWRGQMSLESTEATFDATGNSTVTSTTTVSSSSSLAPEMDTESLRAKAAEIQNILVCLEMLFAAVAHYCVFPAEEWQENYQPQSFAAKPGFAIQDFVADVSDIVTTTTSRRRRRVNNSENDDDDDGVASSCNGSDVPTVGIEGDSNELI